MVKTTDLKHWKLSLPLTGNVYIFGRTDSGKSWKLVAISQGLHSKGYKVNDYFGGKRNEGPFWVFKSEETRLWKEFEMEAGIMKGSGPKSYSVVLGVPCFKLRLKKQLAEDLPRVKSVLIAMNVCDISIEDISLRIGDVTTNAQYVWNTIQKEIGRDGNGEDIQYLMNTKLKKYKELSIYKLFIKPLIDNRFFVKTDSEYNFDLIEESNDTKSIFVLCHEYIPDEFRWFIIGNLLRRTLDLAMSGKIHKKNIAIFREASAFMKVQDKSAQGEEQTQIFRNQLSEVARYARSGEFLLMDTQSPAEVKNLIEGQDDITGICEMSSPKDR